MCWGKQNKVKKGLLKAQINRFYGIGSNNSKSFNPIKVQGSEEHKLKRLRQIQSTNTENKLPIITLKAIHPLFNKK